MEGGVGGRGKQTSKAEQSEAEEGGIYLAPAPLIACLSVSTCTCLLTSPRGKTGIFNFFMSPFLSFTPAALHHEIQPVPSVSLGDMSPFFSLRRSVTCHLFLPLSGRVKWPRDICITFIWIPLWSKLFHVLAFARVKF
jgi:hypothetical protein